MVLPYATSTEFDSIQLHTIYRYAGGVQQSVLVEYCTFVYNILLLYTSLYFMSTTAVFI